jgi:hypothetical protein
MVDAVRERVRRRVRHFITERLCSRNRRRNGDCSYRARARQPLPVKCASQVPQGSSGGPSSLVFSFCLELRGEMHCRRESTRFVREEMVCPLEFSSQCTGGSIGGEGAGEAFYFQLDMRVCGFLGAFSEITSPLCMGVGGPGLTRLRKRRDRAGKQYLGLKPDLFSSFTARLCSLREKSAPGRKGTPQGSLALGFPWPVSNVGSGMLAAPKKIALSSPRLQNGREDSETPRLTLRFGSCF